MRFSALRYIYMYTDEIIFSQTEQLHKESICPDDNFLLENEKKTSFAYNIRTVMEKMFLL